MDSFAKTVSESADRRVAYKVHGFWHPAYIKVRELNDPMTGKVAEVDWSCGGRDHEEEPDDLVAASCFAEAMRDAVKVATAWGATFIKVGDRA